MLSLYGSAALPHRNAKPCGDGAAKLSVVGSKNWIIDSRSGAFVAEVWLS